jgi:HD superfamily phosphohydrolase
MSLIKNLIIKGRLKKDDFSKNEKYILDFVFDLIVEKNTNDGKKYYSVSYINTLEFYNPYKITSYKDFIQINKEIITTIKETTNKIINNQL